MQSRITQLPFKSYSYLKAKLKGAGEGTGDRQPGSADDLPRDRDLEIAFLNGECGAFEEIDRQFRPVLLRDVQVRIRNPELAEDLVQEVFIKAFRFKDSFDPTYPLISWLRTIARNTVTDYERSKGLAPISSGLDYSGDISPEELPSHEPLPEAHLLHKSEKRRLLKIIASLSKVQRKVIWLRFFRQLSYDEIAERMGMSLTAVKCAMYRAKIALEPMLHQASSCGL